MANTLADIRLKVRDRGAFSATDTKLTNAVLDRAINAALAQVSREADWQWLRTSATLTSIVGTADYAVPAGWIRTASLNDIETGTALVRRPVRVLDRDVNQGQPHYYALEGSSITLGPTPSDVRSYKHRYVREEPTLVADGDTPLIPEGYSQCVVSWAVRLLCSSVREMDRSLEASKEYAEDIRRIKDNINIGREPLRIEPREGAWF